MLHFNNAQRLSLGRSAAPRCVPATIHACRAGARDEPIESIVRPLEQRSTSETQGELDPKFGATAKLQDAAPKKGALRSGVLPFNLAEMTRKAAARDTKRPKSLAMQDSELSIDF